MALFRITMIGCKVFYVEADTQPEALEDPAIEDEGSFCHTKVDWEHDETRAEQVYEKEAARIIRQHPKLIL